MYIIFSFISQPRTDKKRINYTKLHDTKFFDCIDQWVRIGASQFRTLKMRQVDYLRLARKCSEEEKKALMRFWHIWFWKLI